jgi:hypothetical protein
MSRSQQEALLRRDHNESHDEFRQYPGGIPVYNFAKCLTTFKSLTPADLPGAERTSAAMHLH